MKTKLFVPLIAISTLALAACDRTEAPDTPDPDADAQVQYEPEPDAGMSDTVSDDPQIPREDIGQTVEEIEQQAADTFESIMEETGQSAQDAMDAGTGAMRSISEQMSEMGSNATDSLASRIDAIIDGVADLSAENMTDEQRIQVVASARTAAEQAARDMGSSDAEVVNAGDTAEERARDLMGL